MSDDLFTAIDIASSGMSVQSKRIRVTSENLANEFTTAKTADGEPYRRKKILFKNELDREIQASRVKVDKIVHDKSEFIKKYDPSHPAASSDGYVNYPNINKIVEIMDAKEAQRSYEANLASIEMSKNMLLQTIDLINK